MKRQLALILLCCPSFTFASYVNSCLLTGVVLKPTSTMMMSFTSPEGEREASKLSVKLQIQKAEKHGRADSGCDGFKGKTLDIQIDQPPLISLKKGQMIKIQSMLKDAFPQQGYRQSYTLILPK
ncbi:hypothetical protein [Acinetobacter sp. ANC 3832]|uniref:hypothetical protein n=1 Tax=Acinetobacter sp. ANC 3832 TaxID=1977874 RepID=UPI000A33757C|nr:hypothetical protein [Acinetobacter sp. ANC 3832]OTG89871.1 hypothetical protein B9T35_15830 [Acinetobacter sp. ANC 3832]